MNLRQSAIVSAFSLAYASINELGLEEKIINLSVRGVLG